METVKNIIYKSKNDKRKCFYVGLSTKGLNHRKKLHKKDSFTKKENSKFYNFLRKYGWKSFDWEVLAVYSTPEELPEAERVWIAEQKKEFSDWECLNLTDGGEGMIGWRPLDTMRKLWKRLRVGKNNPNFGHKWTQKQKDTQSKRFKGKREGENNPNFGIPCSKEKKLKISESLKIFFSQQ